VLPKRTTIFKLSGGPTCFVLRGEWIMTDLFGFLVFFSLFALAVSGIALLFRQKRRKAKWVAAASAVAFVVCIVSFLNSTDDDARLKGFIDSADSRAAENAGFKDASSWRAQQNKIKAEKDAQADVAAKARAAALAARAALLEPPLEQKRFVEALSRGRSQYKAGENDLQRGAARPARAKAICSALSTRNLENWVGTIERLSTNGDGDGVLTVQLADNAHLGTNNNSFSDMTESTLIKSDSSLYRELLRMKINDPIRFSASLFPNSTDCFREHSVTLGGSLDDPIFVVRFSRVQRVELPAIPGERS
jgi:hypothetical protein